VPKIISERCELVKLCHINRSGPVFFETQRSCITQHKEEKNQIAHADIRIFCNFCRAQRCDLGTGKRSVCPSITVCPLQDRCSSRGFHYGSPHVRSQPSDNGGSGRFPRFGPFQGLKIGVLNGCLGEIFNF